MTNKITWTGALVLALILAYSNNAHSETALHVGGYSYHVATGHKYDYNDWHQLVAVEYDSYIAGRFLNSYDRETFVVGYGWSKNWGDIKGSVYVGLTYGYRSCFGDDGTKGRFCPVAFPTLHYTKYDVQPGLLLFGEALAIEARVVF